MVSLVGISLGGGLSANERTIVVLLVWLQALATERKCRGVSDERAGYIFIPRSEVIRMVSHVSDFNRC